MATHPPPKKGQNFLVSNDPHPGSPWSISSSPRRPIDGNAPWVPSAAAQRTASGDPRGALDGSPPEVLAAVIWNRSTKKHQKPSKLYVLYIYIYTYLYIYTCVCHISFIFNKMYRYLTTIQLYLCIPTH